MTELNALKQAVAALTTKTDGLQTDVTNIKTDVGTIETTVEQIAGQGGGSEPWDNITNILFSNTTRPGNNGFVAGQTLYMMALPTSFEIGKKSPDNTEFCYYKKYGDCQINGVTSESEITYLPIGVKFKFYFSSDDSSNYLRNENVMVFIYSK